MLNVSYLFPGQGAQYVGMGKDLYDNSPEAKRIFDIAEETLKLDIKRLCFEGPEEELTRTQNSQVAIVVVSIAALRSLEVKISKCEAAAGLSLGEISALVACGSIDFKDAILFVKKRADYMEEASLRHPGKMASILGLSYEEVDGICKESGAEIANLNCPGQTVISGPEETIERAVSLAEKRGAKKSIILNVSGAFHSSLMKEVSPKLEKELETLSIKPPQIPFVSSVTAEFTDSPEKIRENLVKQLQRKVLWESAIREILKRGIKIFLEVGPGKVLKGLLRRIEPAAEVYNTENIEDIKNVTFLSLSKM